MYCFLAMATTFHIVSNLICMCRRNTINDDYLKSNPELAAKICWWLASYRTKLIISGAQRYFFRQRKIAIAHTLFFLFYLERTPLTIISSNQVSVWISIVTTVFWVIAKTMRTFFCLADDMSNKLSLIFIESFTK